MEKLGNYVERIFSSLSGAVIFLITVVMLAEALFRYIPWLSSAQAWIPGIIMMLNVWLVFLGSVAAMQLDTHLKMSLFSKNVPDALRKKIKLVVNSVSFVLLALVTYYSIPVVDSGMDITFGGVPFSKGYSFIALPICSGIMALIALKRIVDFRKDSTNGDS